MSQALTRFASRLAALLVFGGVVPAASRAQSDPAGHPWVAAARRLKLDSLPGDPKVFYSANHRPHALRVQAFVAEAMEFYRDSLGAVTPFTMLLVSKPDWTHAFGPRFWGFASNRGVAGGDEWAIIQPATGDGALADLIGPAESKAPPELWAELNPGRLSAEELAQRHIDLVVVHEYGHVLVRSGGVPIRWGRDWFQEFLATYLMYAFLASRHPELAQAYTAWDRVVVRVVPEAYTAIRRFDDGDGWQSRVGSRRLLWFYASVGDRVRACYPRHGLDLIRRLTVSLSPKSGWIMPRDELLRILDKECGGFDRWASDMRADHLVK